MRSTRAEVYAAIDSEREYQDKKWGGESHDQLWNVGDWLVFMEVFLDKAKKEYTAFEGNPSDEVRKVAALAIACMEYNGISPRKIKEIV